MESLITELLLNTWDAGYESGIRSLTATIRGYLIAQADYGEHVDIKALLIFINNYQQDTVYPPSPAPDEP